jgi:type IV secretory pathway VirB10-like protein
MLSSKPERSFIRISFMFKRVWALFPRKYLTFGFMFLVFLGFVAVGALLTGSYHKGEASSVRALSAKNLDAVVGKEGTPEYNRMIEEDNLVSATAAREKGESYVAVPVGSKKDSIIKSTTPEKPEIQDNPSEEKTPITSKNNEKNSPKVSSKETQAVQRQPRKQSDSEENNLILNELKKIVPGKAGTPVFSYTAKTSPQNTKEILSEKSESRFKDKLSTGDILYAVTETHVDSDLPSPVTATVVSGDLKGARVLGSFKLIGDKLSLSFKKIILPDSKEMDIEGYGVDPYTQSASVKGKVNTHFFERWGALIASSFIEGLGDSISRRNRRVYHTGETVIEEDLGRNIEDSMYEALGKAGERAATQVEKNFDRPPTVELTKGEPIGILIMEIK